MHQKRLNDELTVVGLILILLFTSYYLLSYVNHTYQLMSKVEEAQKVAILLDKRLTKTEYLLEKTEDQLTKVQTKVSEYQQLDTILKDIATSWDKRKN